jgi:hypothetical protein
MRGLRSTIVLIVILAGLAGYIYFVDNKRPASGTETKEKAFTGVTADDVEEIRIAVAGGDTSRAQKSNGMWKLVEPVQTNADAGELNAIAGGLANLDVDRVLDENPGDLKPYGLSPAKIDVAFRVKGQKDLRHLLIGEKTPTGGDVYAQVPGQKRVILVNSSLDSTFNKNTFALRDKSVLTFDRDKVDGLELTSDGTTVQLARSGDEWKLTKPVAARGDYATIEGIVERLATLQMQGIVAADGGDLKQYGLDRPVATITVVSGSSRATVMFGKTDNALVFAKDVSRPMIFTVAPTAQSDTIKPVADYRRKDLFDSRSFTAEHVELTRGAETLTFDKSKDKDGKDAWRTAAGKDVDATKMEDLLSRLTGLRAQSFDMTANPALKTPALTAKVTYGGKKMESVSFARSGTEVVAARSDEPGSATLEAMSFDDVMKALDAVK